MHSIRSFRCRCFNMRLYVHAHAGTVLRLPHITHTINTMCINTCITKHKHVLYISQVVLDSLSVDSLEENVSWNTGL